MNKFFLLIRKRDYTVEIVLNMCEEPSQYLQLHPRYNVQSSPSQKVIDYDLLKNISSLILSGHMKSDFTYNGIWNVFYNIKKHSDTKTTYDCYVFKREFRNPKFFNSISIDDISIKFEILCTGEYIIIK